jgi:hypothetical protein
MSLHSPSTFAVSQGLAFVQRPVAQTGWKASEAIVQGVLAQFVYHADKADQS